MGDESIDRMESSIPHLVAIVNPLHPVNGPAVTYGRQRLFTKDGHINFSRLHIEHRGRRYLNDLFTTLLDLPWAWILLLFVLSFVLSWVFFAVIWLIIMEIHGDFSHLSTNTSSDSPVPCVAGVTTFAGCVLFSIETQQTIGYGTRSVTEQCASGVILLMIQSCTGLIIQALWVGLVYTKLSRPRKRGRTLIWSRHAVISLRDDQLTLQLRLGDLRHRSTLLEAHVRMYFIAKRVTKEEEPIPLNLLDMDVGFDSGRDRVFLIWPLIIEHRIDSKSPLWEIDKEQLAKAKFEILVAFEGIIESTGMTTQTKTSFMPDEIIWGGRFDRIIHYDSLTRFTIDYARFNSISSDHRTKDCSAKQLQDETQH